MKLTEMPPKERGKWSPFDGTNPQDWSGRPLHGGGAITMYVWTGSLGVDETTLWGPPGYGYIQRLPREERGGSSPSAPIAPLKTIKYEKIIALPGESRFRVEPTIPPQPTGPIFSAVSPAADAIESVAVKRAAKKPSELDEVRRYYHAE